MKAVKAVKFTYKAGVDLHSLLETFRQMCNDAIHIALTEKPKSKFDLIELSYQRLKEYGLRGSAARPPVCSDEWEPRRQETAGNPPSGRVEVSLERNHVSKG